MPDIYSVPEKVQIVKWYCQGQTYRQIRQSFAETFVNDNRPIPTLSTLHNIIHNFETQGCVSPKLHKKPIAVVDEDVELQQIMICAIANEDPTLPSERIADEVGTSGSYVRKVLKKSGYRSYKPQKTQEVFPADHFRRMEFCEIMMERSNIDDNFLRNIVFTDESTFPLLNRPNSSHVRYWSRENLHKFFEVRTQYPQKLNVWGGILSEHVIGPFFIDGTLTGAKYLDLLQQHIVPDIRRIIGDRFNEIWFQHDGCPAHNSRLVKQYLSETFPRRLIAGHEGTILWPARSPDLSPNDFFLWGHVKSSIYGFNAANNLDELRIKIENSFQNISPNTLRNVRRSFYDRLGYCLAQEGGIFEPHI